MLSITNGSGSRLVPSSQQFSVTDSTGHIFGQLDGAMNSKRTSRVVCDWPVTGVVDLALGGQSAPQNLCFAITPADQRGVLHVSWSGPDGLMIDIPFTFDGSRLPAGGRAVTSRQAGAGGGGSVAAGTYTGIDHGLTVRFSTDGTTVSALTFTGTWSCSNGAAELVAVVPGSFPIAADGFFVGNVSGKVAGVNGAWKVSGRISGSSASGTVTVSSDAACALYDAAWTAMRT